MQYSDTTNNDGVIQMIESTLGFDYGTISGDANLLAYFTVKANEWLRIANFYAFQSDNRWIHDDRNHGTFPRFKTDLVDGQNNYQIPSEVLNIRQVEIKDASGKYFSLKFLSEDDPRLNTEKEQETKGSPVYYRLNGPSLILDPKPDTSVLTKSDGLRITVDREVDKFETSDTTKEAGLPERAQSILYYGPSFIYAKTKGLDRVADLCSTMLGGIEGLKDMIEKHYADRNQDDKPRIQRAHQSYK